LTDKAKVAISGTGWPGKRYYMEIE